MMLNILAWCAVTAYVLAALALLVYGLNCYLLIYLFRRKQAAAQAIRAAQPTPADLRLRAPASLPRITTQIPIYNEYNVALRIMRAACALEYPAGRHQIQILDDSTDETRDLIDAEAERLQREGFNLVVLRRNDRTGFKAGALAAALPSATGELIAIFDADFVPAPDFLLRAIPPFLDDTQIGLVQCRWGHHNREASALTRAQAIGIDGHFMVEQAARCWNGLFLNFNGTAGIWRREAIAAGGGWQWDTLTEDMDLSYRTALAGWKTAYLPDVVVPAEIPEDVAAFKSQQFRWAKGSIQTARKILPQVLAAPVGWFTKLQSFFHLTHYMVHPLMITLALLALPVLVTLPIKLGLASFAIFASILLVSMSAPSTLYVVSQQAADPVNWWRRILWLPTLVVIGVGVAVSNTRAVLEALYGLESGFVRTPKRGEQAVKQYRIRMPWIPLLELLLGCYCLLSFHLYLRYDKWLVGPFLAVYAAGFLFIGLLSIAQSLGLDSLLRADPVSHRDDQPQSSQQSLGEQVPTCDQVSACAQVSACEPVAESAGPFLQR